MGTDIFLSLVMVLFLMQKPKIYRDSDDGAVRDALLLGLLKTPPQPRPKRERTKAATKAASKSGSRRQSSKS